LLPLAVDEMVHGGALFEALGGAVEDADRGPFVYLPGGDQGGLFGSCRPFVSLYLRRQISGRL
jgi:hypothetical protein